METPWEAERKARIWRHVWDGLLRGAKTPYWQLPPKHAPHLRVENNVTARIMTGWLPEPDRALVNRTFGGAIPRRFLVS